MKLFPEKRQFVKHFCALSAVILMMCSSLSAAAAMANVTTGDVGDASVQKTAKPSASNIKRVILDVNGEQSTVLFTGETVEELLRFAHIEVKEDRIVFPDVSSQVTPFMAVTVRDAKQIRLTADGKTRTVKLVCGRLDDALRLAGIPLSDGDILSERRDAQVADIDSLTIRRVPYEETQADRK